MCAYIFIFIFGTIIGSFLNVAIFRYKTSESIVYSGSKCLSCGKGLFWYELIPIFSFLFQKGKCRKCNSKISIQYPIAEFLTGIIFCFIFWRINYFFIFKDYIDLAPIIGYCFLFFSLLIFVSVYDFRHQIIPNGPVYFLIFSSFIWQFFFGKNIFDFFGGIGMLIFFSSLWLFSKGKWMGLGDAKLALASGWFLGSINGLIAILFAFWLGAIFSIFLLIFKGKNFTIKSRIPFGPFISLGVIISFLYGNEILHLYLNTFGKFYLFN